MLYELAIFCLILVIFYFMIKPKIEFFETDCEAEKERSCKIKQKYDRKLHEKMDKIYGAQISDLKKQIKLLQVFTLNEMKTGKGKVDVDTKYNDLVKLGDELQNPKEKNELKTIEFQLAELRKDLELQKLPSCGPGYERVVST